MRGEHYRGESFVFKMVHHGGNESGTMPRSSLCLSVSSRGRVTTNQFNPEMSPCDTVAAVGIAGY